LKHPFLSRQLNLGAPQREKRKSEQGEKVGLVGGQPFGPQRL